MATKLTEGVNGTGSVSFVNLFVRPVVSCLTIL
jgi:hypothetical protein